MDNTERFIALCKAYDVLRNLVEQLQLDYQLPARNKVTLNESFDELRGAARRADISDELARAVCIYATCWQEAAVDVTVINLDGQFTIPLPDYMPNNHKAHLRMMLTEMAIQAEAIAEAINSGNVR